MSNNMIDTVLLPLSGLGRLQILPSWSFSTLLLWFQSRHPFNCTTHRARQSIWKSLVLTVLLLEIYSTFIVHLRPGQQTNEG